MPWAWVAGRSCCPWASARRFADTFKAMERRDWATAQTAAQEVIQRSPRFAVARLQLAIALGRLGQAGLAIEQFASARATLRPLPADAGKVIDALIGLRVTTEEEVEGLDINLHGETVH